jgi:ABC-type dipeptide/oligopeptide/nickel transport system permease component
LLQVIPVLIGTTLLIFILTHVIPGDPVKMLAGEKSLSLQAYKNIKHRLWLDRPLHIQYLHYVDRLLHGDFGDSFRYKRPVADMLKEKYPNSVKLAFAAILVEIVIGILAGVVSAVKRYSFLDVLITLSTSIVVCVPVFWLGMMLQILFGLKIKILPISGMGDGSLKYYILPSIVLASVSTAYVARMMRATLLEVMRQDYIRTALAKGLSPVVVTFKHAMKNALIPVVTLIGLDLGTLMGGAIMTEIVFQWDGIGKQVYHAILARDNPVILGSVLILVFIFILVNLLVDISYAFFDPRIRYEKTQV